MAGEGEFRDSSAGRRDPGSDDVAIRLDCDRVGRLRCAEVGCDGAADAEGRIEATVRGIASEGEVARIARRNEIARGKDLSIGLESKSSSHTTVESEHGPRLA